MRIWSRTILDVLPTKQLIAMRYELGDMIKQYPNIKNGLVKYANNYDIIYLGSYFAAVCEECDNRNIRMSQKYNDEILNIVDQKTEIENKEISILKDYKFKEDNLRYLIQQLYNLEEKADREIISKEEWNIIYEKYQYLL